MYRLYVKKVEHYFGVTKTRPVYERAVAELNDVHSRALCLEFADMERTLGEIDRARAILQHGSQFADPRKDPVYWRRWREFEEAHGNEDTFRDMLRVQRSVETANSQANYLAAEMVAGESLEAEQDRDEATGIEAMSKKAEREAQAKAGFLGLGSGPQEPDDATLGGKRKFVPAAGQVANKAATKENTNSNRANPDELDIDEVSSRVC
jgi:pre-mRNA-splicing factor SYF1